MGHKVHPYGFRIGVIKPWLAKWYADRDYASLLQEDMRIRELVAKQLANASVSQVEIERGINHVTVTVHTAKPGIVIGKGGANVEALRTNVGKLTDKKVKLEIKEILQPELDGMLVAQNVAGQLERRIAFRKAIKQSIQRSIKAGAKGVKIQVSGRLGGSEMSRTEWDREGRIPLGTLRADISYGVVLARTAYGASGVQAGVCRGEQLGARPGSARTEPRAPRRAAGGGTGSRGGGRATADEPRPTRAPRRSTKAAAAEATAAEETTAADATAAEAMAAEATAAEATAAEAPAEVAAPAPAETPPAAEVAAEAAEIEPEAAASAAGSVETEDASATAESGAAAPAAAETTEAAETADASGTADEAATTGPADEPAKES